MRNKRQHRRGGCWFGVVKTEVEADRRKRGEPPDLDEDVVLAWADAFFARTGNWPNPTSGPIPEAPGETWLLVAAALASGSRGFPRGGSFARFLNERRGRYNRADQKFTVVQILDWVDAWRARTGFWPTKRSGAIPGAGGVNWRAVDGSLRRGRGVLPGGSSLPHLLLTERGVLGPYTEEQILTWADAYHARTGRWPKAHSGPIAEAPGETWWGVQSALAQGGCGLPGGSSLARLLVKRRAMRSPAYAPPLTIPQILAWADAHHQRTGQWPTPASGPVPETPGETWSAVQSALYCGCRGFPGGSTLAKLLVEHRGKRSVRHGPSLSIPQVLAWADAFRARSGRWPTVKSGPVAEAPGETWVGIESDLLGGFRGLPGGSSLSGLLARERNVNRARDCPSLTIPEIVRRANACHDRHGKWPRGNSGPIPEAPGETWRQVNEALRVGKYGLPGGTTLARVLRQERRTRYARDLNPFTAEGILAWTDAQHARTGEWPTCLSGPIPEAPGETWTSVEHALRRGGRGVRQGSSLTRFLAESGRTRHRVPPRPRCQT